jgi:hypothetical protein
MTSKAAPAAALVLAGSLLGACVGTVDTVSHEYPYGHGPAHPAAAVYRPARILAPAQVVSRLHAQGFRRVESVAFRPAGFWRSHGIHDGRLREGAYVAEIDRARRPDVHVVVDPHTGRVLREYHGRL